MERFTSENIEYLFHAHYREWCLVSFSYLEDMDEAEDVVQDVVEKVLTQLNNSNEILNLKSYIFIAVKNNSIKRLKKSKRTSTILDNDIFEVSHEENLINYERNTYILDMVDTLPDQSKRVFELCVIEGLKYETAAETLNISINTVKYHLKKSYKTLRSVLQDQFLLLVIALTKIFF
ncbi:sigma-70 family RNA polymerase sigma factor [Flavobacterium johnsoniae]|uniref:RNA polymerase sigma factor n=1 Tax=Flavobacterium johnsoniae TaxID=986 RepID=UPI0025B03BED|nr:sigma-70 family RNA polymerase sigma factor [Flavobacterium johnsoniae]WJS93862.1 sigma-70 family RNA polymerase sigma factor [Flavobacterium johnsoniae]